MFSAIIPRMKERMPKVEVAHANVAACPRAIAKKKRTETRNTDRHH